MRSHRNYLILVATVLSAAYFVRLLDPAPVARLRLIAFDTYQQLLPRAYDPGVPVRIIDIDEQSLARLGQWPWPRSRLADLTRRLAEAGAAAVAFDLVFAERDRLSLTELIKELPKSTPLEALVGKLDELPITDRKFADAIASAPTVLGFIAVSEPAHTLPIQRAGFATAGDEAKQLVPAFVGASASIAELQAGAKGSGTLNWAPEHDQIVRHLPLLIRIGEHLFPSLAAEAIRVGQGTTTYFVKASGANGEESFGTKSGITHVRIGGVVVPTDANGKMWLRFTRSDTRRFIPAWSLLAGGVAREQIEGRIILVGTSAAGLFDLRTTPLDAAVPGVEIHAQAIEQILLGQYLRRPDFATGAESSFLVVSGLILSMLVYRFRAAWSALLGAIAVVSCAGISWFAFANYSWLLDPVYPTISLTLLYIATTIYVYLQTEGERNRVRHAFSHYMAPSVIEELARHPEKLKLGGETRLVTLYRSDLAGFSSISEQLRPDELVLLMNEYLSAMTDIIMEHGGFVDKYIGDAIDGVFGAPRDDPDHALNAVMAALACQAKLGKMNDAGLKALRGHKLRQRIGLHTGFGVVGNIGSRERFNYTVMGDSANLASRLEGANKNYGTTIIASEATVKLASAKIAWRELDIIQVVGRSEKVRIYEPLALAETETELHKKIAASYAEGLDFWRSRDFAGSAACFGRFSEIDPPSWHFEERARQLLSAPPTGEWVPVNVLASK